MSPRGRKVGGLDDPIWDADVAGTDGGDSTSDSPDQNQVSDSNGGSGNTQVGQQGEGRRQGRTTDEPSSSRSSQPARGPQHRRSSQRSQSSQRNGGGSSLDRPRSKSRARANAGIDIPRRILVEDPGTARTDERECEIEGWFQSDDGVPVSSALRPLSVACARPFGHTGRHRSKARRAFLRSGRVWVYEWSGPETDTDE